MPDLLYVNNSIFPVSVAVTTEEQKHGLMGKEQASILLFPFPKKGVHKFWMKNTLIPLDIIFTCQGQITEICKGQPYSLNLIGSEKKSDLVIEAQLGFCQQSNLLVGSRVKVAYSLETLSKIFNNKLLQGSYAT